MTRFWSKHVSQQLARYCDGQVPPAKAAAIESHLARCARCRADHDDIVFAGRLVRQLATAAAPPDLWAQIEAQLQEKSPGRWVAIRTPVVAWALTLVVMAGLGYWFTVRDRPQPWTVTRTGDAPRQMASGEWIETADGVSARITVGEIGTVDVEPGARVRLGLSAPGEHRLTLERGTVRAEISAPPRVFIVETPVSTVVDLGCAYTVTVDGARGGLLRMTQGWAALEWEGRQSLVPAGAICRMRKDVGPGLPYFEDASPRLKEAVTTFDAGTADGDVIDAILTGARPRDTLTLWHLIARVQADDRERIYDRMAALVDPPPSISREKALALDAATLQAWREELAWSW
jgi:hypothetical protein